MKSNRFDEELNRIRSAWERERLSALTETASTPRAHRERTEDDNSQKIAEPTINPIDWFSHALLVAAQGSGKTNLIRWRINQILPFIKKGQATLILLDPKDVLTRELPTLVRSLDLEDRTVLIDPLEAPVSFNLFDRGDGSRKTINDTVNGLIRLLNMITLELRDFQEDTLTFAIKALFATSNEPSFDKLFPILRQGKLKLDLNLLPPSVRDYFEHDFREADGHYIISRLNKFRDNPYFEPFVTGNAPTFDLQSQMQAGRIILIKADIDEPLYGKIWLEQISKTILSRFSIEEKDRIATFVIIDEADTFIGDKDNSHFARILNRAREARIGVFVALQHMELIENPSVRQSLYNSAIKFIARTSGDIHSLARSMPGQIDANSFRRIPRYHFVFSSPESIETELIKVPRIPFPRPKPEDVRFFWQKKSETGPKEDKTETIATPAHTASDEERKPRGGRRLPSYLDAKSRTRRPPDKDESPAGSEGSNQW